MQVWVDEMVRRSESVLSWDLAGQKYIDIATVRPFLLLLLLGSLTLPGRIYTYSHQNSHNSHSHRHEYHPTWKATDYLLAFRCFGVELVSLYALLTVVLGHTLKAKRKTRLADKTSIIIVSFHSHTPRVLCVEVPVLG